jgi:hypothetical protein
MHSETITYSGKKAREWGCPTTLGDCCLSADDIGLFVVMHSAVTTDTPGELAIAIVSTVFASVAQALRSGEPFPRQFSLTHSSLDPLGLESINWKPNVFSPSASAYLYSAAAAGIHALNASWSHPPLVRGTSLLCLQVIDHRANVVNVGGCQLYHLDDGLPVRATPMRIVPLPEISTYILEHVVEAPWAEPDFITFPLPSPRTLFLCSEGVWRDVFLAADPAPAILADLAASMASVGGKRLNMHDLTALIVHGAA